MTTYIWPEGGGGQDRFAPKYLIGNVPAGDSAAAYSTDGFIYIPDPGDGSGIAAALALIAGNPSIDPPVPAVPGDVWIRPGLYDLDLGTVPVPLVVPQNTRVQGAGLGTTVIQSKGGTGSQGVFQLSAACQLRDLQISTPPDNPSTGGAAAALVEVRGSACVLANLLIAYQATTNGALRYGIDVNTSGQVPIPFSSLENVSITVDSVPTPPAGSVSLLHMVEGEVSARNLLTLGGNVGIEMANQANSAACVFFGSDVLCVGWSDYGLRYYEAALPAVVGSGAARISTGIFVGSGVGTGMQLEGGFLHVLRSGFIRNIGAGVYVVPPTGRSASIQIDDCLIRDYTRTGVEFDGSAGTINSSSVSDTEITSPVQTGPFSLPTIYVQGVNTSGISLASNTLVANGSNSRCIVVFGANDTNITGNDITVDATDANSRAISVEAAESTTITDNNIDADAYLGIYVDGQSTRTAITSNDVRMVGNVVQTFAAIWSDASRTTITANTILAADEAQAIAACAILSSGARSTITGNTVELNPASGPAVPAIVVTGNQSACTGNVAGVDTSPTAAIAVSGNNCTVIANVCGTVPTVLDTGVGNEVAHNT